MTNNKDISQKTIQLMQDAAALRDTCSYDKIRNTLILRPVAYEKEQLDGYVYNVVGDIAIVLHQLVSMNHDQLITSKIIDEEMQSWDVTDKNVIMQNAMQNTASRFKAAILNNNDDATPIDPYHTNLTLKEILGGHAGVLLSTQNGTNGALALFYPGMREQLLRLFNGPCYAIFMNTTDVMLLPESVNGDYLKRYLDIGTHPTPFGDILSHQIWICNEKGIYTIK